MRDLETGLLGIVLRSLGYIEGKEVGRGYDCDLLGSGLKVLSISWKLSRMTLGGGRTEKTFLYPRV